MYAVGSKWLSLHEMDPDEAIAVLQESYSQWEEEWSEKGGRNVGVKSFKKRRDVRYAIRKGWYTYDDFADDNFGAH